jgi:tetratricopeptide (TPR) repeat protein
MFRKSFISFILTGLAVFFCNAAIFAQTAPVNGTVELTKADGTREPVAGALVEVYRIDIKAGFPSAKTGKKGEFSFAGLQFGATYLFSVSAPGCSPTTYPNVKAGQEKLLITMVPGDGRKLSEAEARQAGTAKAATAGTTELTAEQKKEFAALEVKNKEITVKNEKVLKANEVIAQSLKDGNEAFAAKNYDLAVAKYEEGIAADPDFVGSVPILSNNRSSVLRARGVDYYNKAVKSTDVSEKVANMTKAKQDLAESAQGYLRSWKMLTNAPVADITDRANYDNNKKVTLAGALDTFKMAMRTEQVDQGVIDAAKMLIPEYIAAETDAAKKADASLIFADLYRVVGDSENAIAGYKAILETSPDNIDALAGAGLSLVNLGYIKFENGKSQNNKAMMDEGKRDLQEGANLLGKFASAAPDTHKYKADAVGLIETLKKEQNVTPQKVTTTKRKN